MGDAGAALSSAASCGDGGGADHAVSTADHRQLRRFPGATSRRWLDPAGERVYAVLDNLRAHRALDVLLWALAHPRWEFVFQARLRRLPQPDRALVEGVAFPGAEGPPLRDLGRGLGRRWRPPRATGTPTAIRSSGESASAAARPAPPASPASRWRPILTGWATGTRNSGKFAGDLATGSAPMAPGDPLRQSHHGRCTVPSRSRTGGQAPLSGCSG